MLDYIRLEEAAKMLPTKPAVCTLWRWCVQGLSIKGSDEVVRLRFALVGRRMFTTAEWVEIFIHESTAARMAYHQQRQGAKSDRRWQRAQQLAEADEILRRAGI